MSKQRPPASIIVTHMTGCALMESEEMMRNVLNLAIISLVMVLTGCTDARAPGLGTEQASEEIFVCPPLPTYEHVVQRTRLADAPFGGTVIRYATTQSMADVYAWYRTALSDQWRELSSPQGVLFRYEYRGLNNFPDTTLAIQEEANGGSAITVFRVKLRSHHPHDSRDWCPNLEP